MNKLLIIILSAVLLVAPQAQSFTLKKIAVLGLAATGFVAGAAVTEAAYESSERNETIWDATVDANNRVSEDLEYLEDVLATAESDDNGTITLPTATHPEELTRILGSGYVVDGQPIEINFNLLRIKRAAYNIWRFEPVLHAVSAGMVGAIALPLIAAGLYTYTPPVLAWLVR